MTKELKKIGLYIEITPDNDEPFLTATNPVIKESADIHLCLSEYPTWDAQKKGIPIVLTELQETAIITHVRTIVLPQANAAK